jgi:hypothetical protein
LCPIKYESRNKATATKNEIAIAIL